MKSVAIPRVKICCISSINEAQMAISYGASALGLVAEMPSGPGVIAEELIAQIAQATPPATSTFLLTSQQKAESIAQQHLRCRTSTIQICDRLETEWHFNEYQQLRERMPGIRLVQVIHVVDESSIDEALMLAPYVDALLLDSGNQSLAIKELGGTGRVHNWQISRQIREQVNKPIFLAGGLTPDNVLQAIELVGPFGVDICSGVRSNGQLDEQKLAKFFAQINKLYISSVIN